MPRLNLKFKKSFTLIELLVVISIIAILLAIASVAYSNVQMKGRDAQRKAKLATVQQALEQFYADNGAYPMSKKNYNGSNSTDSTSGYYPGAGSHAGKIDSITCSIGPVDTNKMNTNVLTGLAWGSDAFTCNGKTYMSKLPDDNYPRTDAAANLNPYDHGFVYAIYPFLFPNALADVGGIGTYSPVPPNGWCKASYSGGTTSGVPATVQSCQQYTLWTTLENPNDPDILKTQLDPICRAAAHFDQLWDNPANSLAAGNWNPGYWVNTTSDAWPPTDGKFHSSWDAPTFNWAVWAAEDPNNAALNGNPSGDHGTRNYCVHGPSR